MSKKNSKFDFLIYQRVCFDVLNKKKQNKKLFLDILRLCISLYNFLYLLPMKLTEEYSNIRVLDALINFISYGSREYDNHISYIQTKDKKQTSHFRISYELSIVL